MKDRLLKVPEVADRLGITVGTLRNWICWKRIDVVRLSARAVRIRESVVERLLRDRTDISATPG